MTETTGKTLYSTLSTEDYILFKTWIKSILKNGSTTVEFFKKDGTERKMLCTLDPELIPGSSIGDETKEKTRKVSEEALPVYDLDAGAWRSFRYDSVFSVTISLKENEEGDADE